VAYLLAYCVTINEIDTVLSAAVGVALNEN